MITEEDKVQFYLSEVDVWEVLDLPFEFEFYQEKYEKVWMSSQGVLSFDEIEDESLSYFVPPSVPNDDELNNIIAPYFAAGGPNTNLAEDKWGRYMKAFDDKVVFEWRGYNNLFYIGGEFSIQAMARRTAPTRRSRTISIAVVLAVILLIPRAAHWYEAEPAWHAVGNCPHFLSV